MIEDIFLKDFLEIFADGIFIVDLKGELQEVNKNFTDLLRDQRKELIGKNITDVFSCNASQLSGKSHMPLMVKLKSEGYVKDQEIQYARKDAAVLFAKLNIKSIVDSRGKTTNYIGAVHDITEQKVWKQKTEEKEAFLRKIIHTDPNLIFVKHRNGKYVEVSEGLAKLFGLCSDDLVGKTDLELAEIRKLSIPEAENIRAADTEVLDTGKQKFIAEESITQYDGQIKWYQTTKVPLVLNNNADYVLGVAVDITIQKNAIDLLKEKENELEIKNKNLEELNAALKIVLQQKENDRGEFENKILNSLKILVEPYLNKLKILSTNTSQKNFIEIIETNLKEIATTFSVELSSGYINLTKSELQVADLVKKDFSNKEIAEQLNMAGETVSSHRKHIRKKLGITNKKTNLSSFLKSLQ